MSSSSVIESGPNPGLAGSLPTLAFVPEAPNGGRQPALAVIGGLEFGEPLATLLREKILFRQVLAISNTMFPAVEKLPPRRQQVGSVNPLAVVKVSDVQDVENQESSSRSDCDNGVFPRF